MPGVALAPPGSSGGMAGTGGCTAGTVGGVGTGAGAAGVTMTGGTGSPVASAGQGPTARRSPGRYQAMVPSS